MSTTTAPAPAALATPAPHLTLGELLAPVAPDAAVSALGPLAGAAGSARAGRGLFGGARPSLEQVARGPTESGLRDAQHTEPAGTMNHDRTASRRAIEGLVPLFHAPEVARAVSRAPAQYLANVQSVQPAGVYAIGAEAALGHGGNGLPEVYYGGHSTCPPRHIVTVLVELDQDEAERVTAARVVTSSRQPTIDAVALAAVRDAVAAVPPVGSRQSRRSRWRVEISDRPSASRTFCTDGFMETPPDPVNGVYLMFRVRRDRP